MPSPRTSTRAEARLALVLAALMGEWRDQETLIVEIGVYPEAYQSARRMLRRDMRALLALGFQVERSAGHHDPSWRIVGHTRFGAIKQD